MNKKNSRVLSILILVVLLTTCIFSLTGCAWFDSAVDDLNGDITGNTYTCKFYSNTGENFMNMKGQKINLKSNIIEESVYKDGTWGYTKTLSSVVTINIDGNQVQNCGSTVIFSEDGLNPEVDFKLEEISSIANGFADNTFISGIVNTYKNKFGKPVVVVIQSQLGNPICAYSGDSVYWEVREDLPKTTKLMIDGKSLYIHRANFQIIDKGLLN